MRIGVISERPWASDIRLRKLLDELKQSGHSIFVLCGGGEAASAGVSPDGTAYSELPIPAGFSKVWTLEFLSETYLSPRSPWVPEIERFLREVKPDVLHVNDLPLSAVVCRIAVERSLPVVVDYHHEGWPEMVRALAEIRGATTPWWSQREEVFRLWEEIEQSCFFGATRILMVDEALIAVFSDRGCAKDKLAVVRNTPRPGDLPRPNGRREFAPFSFDLGYLGSYDLMKDIPGLIRAVAGIPKARRPKLLLAGAGEQETEVRSLVAHLQLDEAVTPLGWVQKQRFGELIEACKVCLIPFRVNPFTHQTSPSKVFEYMYFSRPVLSSAMRHVSTLLRSTECGLSCSFDGPSFAEAFSLLSEPKVLREFGSRGREAVEKQYAWADDAGRLVRQFQTIG